MSSLGPGQPLDPATRNFMEPRFGRDFSQVRLHSDASAAHSAGSINALAYTVGPHIVLGKEHTVTSRHQLQLLAHELTHVVQQGYGPMPSGYGSDQLVGTTPNVGATQSAAIGSTPVQVARGKGPGSFKITPHDMEYLQKTLVQLMNRLRDETRGRILLNDTVALGLVVDPDGDPSLVFTVAGNRTYRELTAEAKKLGIEQWKPRARTEGRGDVGAPEDAEQLMIEGGLATGSRVAGMAVTRTVCEDCKEAAAEAEKGGIPIVEVSIPIPEAARLRRRGQRQPKGGGSAGKAKAATPKTKSKATPEIEKPPAAKGTSAAPPEGKSVSAPKVEDVPKVKPPVHEGEGVGHGEAAKPVPELKVKAPAAPPDEHVTVPKGEVEIKPKLPVVEGEATLPRVTPKGVAPEGGAVHGGGGTGIAVFHLLLLLGQMIPDDEEVAVQDEMNKALNSPQSLARFRELQPVVAQAKGFIYYNVKFKILYTITSSPKPQTFPNHTYVKGVEILEISLGTTYLSNVSEMDPPIHRRPDSASPIYGGGFWWHAQRTGTLSMQVLSGEQTARGAAARISPQELQSAAELTSDKDIRTWVANHDPAAIAEVGTDVKIKLLNRLLDGWVSDADLYAVSKICASVKSSDESRTIRRAIEPRAFWLTSSRQEFVLRTILKRMP